ncbi:MAG: hypothetical protein E6L07_12170 [Verrucomicrobia bacterium]|nr:MAG: hypothetical protein E6L07_12170 [Verrucomicrobiota bacterium]
MGNSESAVIIGYVGTDQCGWKSNSKIDNAKIEIVTMISPAKDDAVLVPRASSGLIRNFPIALRSSERPCSLSGGFRHAVFKQVIEFFLRAKRARRGLVAHLDEILHGEINEHIGIYRRFTRLGCLASPPLTAPFIHHKRLMMPTK